MKKTLLFLFSLCIWLAGCSNDDDDKQDNTVNLVGTWWLYESYIPASDDTFDYCDQNRLLIFNSDGNYHLFRCIQKNTLLIDFPFFISLN